MGVFDTIRTLKGTGQYEEAWQHGCAALQQDQHNEYLQTTLFWVIYAALKQKIDPIKKRKNTKPFPAEQNWIDAWTARIAELNLSLPSDNIDYRLWNLFTHKDIGPFCNPLCLYILSSGRALFRLEDYIPYRTANGESPSVVCKLARIVAANYLYCQGEGLPPVGKITGFLQYAFETTEDSSHKVWLIYDKARVLAASGQIERARQAYMEVLEQKRSESWAWFDLATTYTDEPSKASSLIAYGLTCVHDPKFSIKGLYHFASLQAQQSNYADASRALIRLSGIYQQNGWAIRKEVSALMASSWYDNSLDEAELNATIRTLAASANQYVLRHPVVYKGVVEAIHKSGKGANIYIGPERIISVFKRLFQTRTAFRPGTFIEILCDEKSDEIIPVSVKKIEPFSSENICVFAGALKLTERGFGFVNNIFVPPFLTGDHANGEEVSGLAVLKLDKVKNVNSFAAVTMNKHKVPRPDMPHDSNESQ